MSATQSDMFGTTLSAARAEVMAGRRNAGGVICPCCDGLAKMYVRKFNKTMAAHLVLLCKWNHEAPGEWHHVKRRFIGERRMNFNAEFARLADYELIESPDGVQPDGNPDGGYYRITPAGIDFVLGMCTVPTRLTYYKGRVLEVDSERINIEGALGRPFIYKELWTDAPPATRILRDLGVRRQAE